MIHMEIFTIIRYQAAWAVCTDPYPLQLLAANLKAVHIHGQAKIRPSLVWQQKCRNFRRDALSPFSQASDKSTFYPAIKCNLHI